MNNITIKEAVNTASLILKQNGVEENVFESRMILCHILNCDRTFLYTNEDSLLGEKDRTDFLKQIYLRGSGFPIQYIIGEQEFMSLSFKVTPAVLIPRADTEVLVEAAIDYVKEKQSECGIKNKQFKILDIGTGSGCISVALAYYLKNAMVTAVDISPDALIIAKENAQRIGVDKDIKFIHSDLFSAVDSAKEFDIIVSNPPYITEEEMHQLQREVVEHEPTGALYGGKDGLEFYRKIIKESLTYLDKQGAIFLEVGYKQASEVAILLEEQHFGTRIVKDLSGIERVVIGILNY